MVPGTEASVVRQLIHEPASVIGGLGEGEGDGGVRRDGVLAHAAVVGVDAGGQIGGKAERREAAQARLRALTDSLHAAGQPRTLAVGDFNEDLWGSGAGTIKYNGRWEKIDGGFAEGFPRVREEVFADPLLLEEDKAFGGMKPRRTFVGPRYTGGVSDHLPVVFIVYY